MINGSGEISMGDIAEEFGFTTSTTMNLELRTSGIRDQVWIDGAWRTLNACSTFKPTTSTPHNMSDWYKYNHTQVCPGPPYVEVTGYRVCFQICNSNAVTDDNFDIYLNGTKVGDVILLTNGVKNGSVFIGDTNTGITITSSDFVCDVNDMVSHWFSPSLLYSGQNTISMVNISNNGYNNYGSIGIRNFQLSGSYLSTPTVLDDLVYSGVSGESFTFNFTL